MATTPTIKGIFVKSHIRAVQQAKGQPGLDELQRRFGRPLTFQNNDNVLIADEIRLIDLAAYRVYVQHQLDTLSDIFARASIGDFSVNVDIPEGDDEFTELYVGVQIMVEVIRQKIAALETVNHELRDKIHDAERLNKILVGREVKMVELKKEVQNLKKKFEAFNSK